MKWVGCLSSELLYFTREKKSVRNLGILVIYTFLSSIFNLLTLIFNLWYQKLTTFLRNTCEISTEGSPMKCGGGPEFETKFPEKVLHLQQYKVLNLVCNSIFHEISSVTCIAPFRCSRAIYPVCFNFDCDTISEKGEKFLIHRLSTHNLDPHQVSLVTQQYHYPNLGNTKR